VYEMDQRKPITVVFSTEDFEKVAQRARKVGLSRASFIRLQVLKAIATGINEV